MPEPVPQPGSVWFADDPCPRCGARMATNRRYIWCAGTKVAGEADCTYGIFPHTVAVADYQAVKGGR